MSKSDKKQLLENTSDDYGSVGNVSSGYTEEDMNSEKSLPPSKPLLKGTMKRNVSVMDVEVPITLAWNNINVFAPPKGGKTCFKKEKSAIPPKQILKNVSGIVTPGSLLAILGASGSGKTTLLNVLTSRNNSSLVIDGDVRVNGRCMGTGIANLSAYVQQDDLFIGTMTVKEHLMFHANLRLGEKHSPEEKMMKVEETMSELGLKKCEDTLIGIPGMIKGLSGGERKRLSFGQEVLTGPSLMFCDEPTSGLDAFMAQSIIQCLKNMASKGRTILCTIHQPSSEVYSLMDEVLLMAEGRVAYMGPTETVLNFFKSIGYPSPDNYNPADFFIHTLAVVPGRETECKSTVSKVCDYFEASPYHHKILSMIGDVNSDTDQFVIEMDNLGNMYRERPKEKSNKLQTYDDEVYCTGRAQQFSELYKRAWLANIRNPMVTRARVIQIIIISFIYCLFYLGQYDDGYNQRSVQNLNGALLIMQTQLTIGNIFAVANTFPSEFNLFNREHSNFMYRRSAYYVSRLLADLPVFLLIPFLLVGITYYIIGFYMSWEAFFVQLGVFLLVSMDSIAFAHAFGCSTDDVALVLTGTSAAMGPLLLFSGYFLAAITNDVAVVLIFCSASLGPLLLYSGFFLNKDSIPIYLVPFQYFSWYFYSMELLMVNLWENVNYIKCEYVTVVNGTSYGDHSGCYKNGDDVLNSYSFTGDNDVFNYCMMAALFFFYEILGYLLLFLRTRRKRS